MSDHTMSTAARLVHLEQQRRRWNSAMAVEVHHVDASPDAERETIRPSYPAASATRSLDPMAPLLSADSESEDEETLFVSSIQRGYSARTSRGRAPIINLATSANAVHPNHSRSWAENARTRSALADSRHDWEGEGEDDQSWRPRLWPKDDHDVWELRCNSCKTLVCSRGQKEASFTSRSFERKANGKRFASDAPPPDTVSALLDESVEERIGCSCRRIKFGCRCCGQVLGQHVAELCSSCLRYSRRSPPMPFFFSEQAVSPSLRQDSAEKYGWEDLPPLKEDYADGLIGDPCDWLFPTSRFNRSLPYWLPYRKPAHSAWSCPDDEPREAEAAAMRNRRQPEITSQANRAAATLISGVQDHGGANLRDSLAWTQSSSSNRPRGSEPLNNQTLAAARDRARTAATTLDQELDRRYTLTRRRDDDPEEEISLEEFLADRRSRAESWGSRRDRLKGDIGKEEEAANWDDKNGTEIHFWLNDRVQYGMLASEQSVRLHRSKRRALLDFENR